MDEREVTMLRADVDAEAYLAAFLRVMHAETGLLFTEGQIEVLRDMFKLGWVTGYRAAMGDVAARLQPFVDDIEREENHD